MVERKPFLQNLPCIDKNNFRIYHDPEFAAKKAPRRFEIQHKSPNYPIDGASDNAVGRIYNQPKPQLLLKYLTRRGPQGEEAQTSCPSNGTGKRKRSGVKEPVSRPHRTRDINC